MSGLELVPLLCWGDVGALSTSPPFPTAPRGLLSPLQGLVSSCHLWRWVNRPLPGGLVPKRVCLCTDVLAPGGKRVCACVGGMHTCVCVCALVCSCTSVCTHVYLHACAHALLHTGHAHVHVCTPLHGCAPCSTHHRVCKHACTRRPEAGLPHTGGEGGAHTHRAPPCPSCTAGAAGPGGCTTPPPPIG